MSVNPQSVRLGEDLLAALDRHIGMRQMLGDRVTRADVIREALEIYLDANASELREAVLDNFGESR